MFAASTYLNSAEASCFVANNSHGLHQVSLTWTGQFNSLVHRHGPSQGIQRTRGVPRSSLASKLSLQPDRDQQSQLQPCSFISNDSLDYARSGVCWTRDIDSGMACCWTHYPTPFPLYSSLTCPSSHCLSRHFTECFSSMTFISHILMLYMRGYLSVRQSCSRNWRPDEHRQLTEPSLAVHICLLHSPRRPHPLQPHRQIAHRKA